MIDSNRPLIDSQVICGRCVSFVKLHFLVFISNCYKKRYKNYNTELFNELFAILQ